MHVNDLAMILYKRDVCQAKPQNLGMLFILAVLFLVASGHGDEGLTSTYNTRHDGNVDPVRTPEQDQFVLKNRNAMANCRKNYGDETCLPYIFNSDYFWN